MTPFQTLKETIQNFDQKGLYQATGAAVAFVIFLGGITLFWHQGAMKKLEKRLAGINQVRKESRELIEQYQQVKQQRVYVGRLFESDRTFKIKDFVNKVVESLNLKTHLNKEIELRDAQDLQNGYRELALGASFTGLDMKNVCDLIDTLEKNKLVYFKEMTIIKVGQMLDLSIGIATLQPKAAQT